MTKPKIIEDLDDMKEEAALHSTDYSHIKISDDAPATLKVGNIWFDLEGEE